MMDCIKLFHQCSLIFTRSKIFENPGVLLLYWVKTFWVWNGLVSCTCLPDVFVTAIFPCFPFHCTFCARNISYWHSFRSILVWVQMKSPFFRHQPPFLKQRLSVAWNLQWVTITTLCDMGLSPHCVTWTAARSGNQYGASAGCKTDSTSSWYTWHQRPQRRTASSLVTPIRFVCSRIIHPSTEGSA